ncbi:MAG: hypothetical protein OEV06_07495 [Anaerolineae bacterium]|nr:hypothetical protein [Anaerolineae bacterium]
MKDSQKTCLGFVFLIIAMGIAIASLILGGLGTLVEAMGGSLFGLNLQTGFIIGLVAFLASAVLAVFMFFQVRNLAWLPTIIAGVYTVLPDIMAGPTDDIGALLIGGVLSGLLAWRQNRSLKEKPPADFSTGG